MPEFENDQQAAEALFAAVQSDRQETRDTPSIQADDQYARSQEQVTEPAEGQEPGTTVEDSFTKLDPNTIPPELMPWYKSMQADYTRSKQELAGWRDERDYFQEFGGVDAAREAVQFVQALSTDPQYALEVHRGLTAALQSAGLSPVQAERESARRINEAIDQGQDGLDDDIGFSDSNPAYDRKIQQLESQLNAVNQWREEQEEYAFQRSLMADMDRQHAEVLRNNPDYEDEDMEAVYQLAYSTGGDLVAADNLYRGFQSNILGRYVSQKASTPLGVSSPTGTGYAEQPAKFNDLNDPALERLVQQRLLQELANS